MAVRSCVTRRACMTRAKSPRRARAKPARNLHRLSRIGSSAASPPSLSAPDWRDARADRQIAPRRDRMFPPMRLGGPVRNHLSPCSTSRAQARPRPARSLRSLYRSRSPMAGGAAWRKRPAHDWTAAAATRLAVAPMRGRRAAPAPGCPGIPVLLPPQAWSPWRGYDGRRSATCRPRCGPVPGKSDFSGNSDRRGYRAQSPAARLCGSKG